MRKSIAVFIVSALATVSAPAFAAGDLENVMWDVLKPRLLGDAPVVTDDRIVLSAPPDAENALAAPVFADASALGEVQEIVLIADLNPFPLILRFKPEAARAVIGARFKVQQTTPLRAVARTADGVWHMKTVMVEAVGGGCTQPAAAYAEADWTDRLGEVSAAAFKADRGGETATRLRFSVRHPMDTGLAAGIPAYFVEQMTLRDGTGAVLARIEGAEPVAENPVFTVEVKRGLDQKLILDGRDNSGADFRAVLHDGGGV
jgi:sulfur-oxidizing protein SoxY